jgi:4a-hydroxytetrahydrobiopterin dehydratase
MARQRLSDQEIASALETLPGWSQTAGKLHREYQFPSFSLAFGFMAAAAPGIEKRDHHPEWSNVYNRITVDLTTHDAGGITSHDVELAKILEDLAKRFL